MDEYMRKIYNSRACQDFYVLVLATLLCPSHDTGASSTQEHESPTEARSVSGVAMGLRRTGRAG